MKKGFKSPKLMAILMAVLMSVNSMPVTAFADEADFEELEQSESVMERETEEETLTEESQEEVVEEESAAEETVEEEADIDLQNEEESQTEEETENSGTCGENLIWTLDDAGVLTISGTGQMTRYYDEEECPWYSIREKIVSVVIEDGVTSIGTRAFYGCSNLYSVKMPDSVTKVGGYAFYNCSNLAEINLPDGVDDISYYVFYNCSSLTEIVIPKNVSEVAWRAFEGCSSLRNVTFKGFAPGFDADSFNGVTATVHYPGNDSSWTEYVGKNFAGNLTWEPYTAELVGYSGTCGENATWTLDREGLLTISGTGAMENYDDINNRAPWHSKARYIVSASIEDGVTSIGSHAFENCDQLTNIEMSDSVASIGDYAFEYCSSLTYIDLSSGVQQIKLTAFTSCDSLSAINVAEANENYTSVDGVLFDSAMTTVIFYPRAGKEEYTIPNGVEKIGDSAFNHCKELRSIEIPNSVTSIEACAFKSCGLYSINIPISVTSIGRYAFDECSSLFNVEMSQSLLFIGDYAFNDCSNLTSIEIPDSVSFIGDYVFSNCSSLESIKIPDNFTTIEEGTFFGCSSLQSIEIPDSITDIEPSAFKSCSGLEHVEIPEGVTNIGYSAFAFCSSLESVGIPASVTTIGDSAFDKCSSLKAINVAEANKNYASKEGILFDAAVTTLILYPSCMEKTVYTIPNGITTIGSRAFSGCKELISIEIPSSVGYIGESAFWECSNLAEITFNGSAPNFGDGGSDAFYDVTATAYYPADDPSWTEEVRKNYAGTITWVAKGSETEEKELTILQQPESVTGKIGETAVFTVEAEGDGITYQWQYCNSGSSTWKNSSMTGFTTNSIEVKITKGRVGQKYRCILKDSRDNKLISEEAQIMLAESKELAITKQPESVTGKIGGTAVFTVGAEGDGLTYQWQYCNSDSSIWKTSSMTGADTSSIEVKITKGRIGQKYRCILKDSKGNKLTTEEAQIIQAEEKKLAVIQQPESVTGKIGDIATFTVEAEGEGVTYQWQYCNSGSSTWKNSSMTGSTTNSIEVKITKGRIGQKYRCILKDSKGNKLTTEEAQIKLAEEKELAIIKQPESVIGKVGETAVFTVEAEGEGVTYQWQYCNNGSTSWANSKMTGYDTNSIEVKITKGRVGQKYRCILKDSKGNNLTTEEAQIIQ